MSVSATAVGGRAGTTHAVYASARCGAEIATTPALAPYRGVAYDTLKIFHKAFQAKPDNPVVDLAHDERILVPEAALYEQGVEHETVLSYFNRAAFETYRRNPVVRWE